MNNLRIQVVRRTILQIRIEDSVVMRRIRLTLSFLTFSIMIHTRLSPENNKGIVVSYFR